jgi:hypothetical protein
MGGRNGHRVGMTAFFADIYPTEKNESASPTQTMNRPVYSIETIDGVTKVWYSTTTDRCDVTSAIISAGAKVQRAAAGILLEPDGVYVVDKNRFVCVQQTTVGWACHIYSGENTLRIMGGISACAFPFSPEHLYMVSAGALQHIHLCARLIGGALINKAINSTSKFVLDFIQWGTVIMRTGETISIFGDVRLNTPARAVKISAGVCTIETKNDMLVLTSGAEKTRLKRKLEEADAPEAKRPKTETTAEARIRGLAAVKDLDELAKLLEFHVVCLSVWTTLAPISAESISAEYLAVSPRLAHIPGAQELLELHRKSIRVLAPKEIARMVRGGAAAEIDSLLVTTREKTAAGALASLST